MKYGLFLGCNMPAIRPDVERAIRYTMPELGVELVDLENYVCCPAFGTFPSLDEDAHLAVSAWNLTISEEKGLDLIIECGSCYSSLRTSKHLLAKHEDKRKKTNELLEKTGKIYKGTATPRHLLDVLYNEVGPEAVAKKVKKPLEGARVVVQYPCHTMFPSEIVGFEDSSTTPRGLAALVEALGAEVVHFSLEYQCCGGAGGFHGSSRAEAEEFAKQKLDAIVKETKADFIVVSCITCLMHLDNVQEDLNKRNGDGDGNGNGKSKYSLPVFDYNQILALCMGFPPDQVAAISKISRDDVIKRFF